MKVLFVTNLPSPYRVDFFNELSKKCELTVVYERTSSSERDTAWKNETQRSYKEIFCKAKTIGADKTFGFDLVRRVKKTEFDHLIISGYSSPSVILLILYCKRKKIPYFIETDGGFSKKGKGFSEKLKRYLIKGAKAIFTTCEGLKRYYLDIGYRGPVYKYPLSSFSRNEIFEDCASDEEKKRLRRELGMTEEKIVITVGRFSYKNGYGKGYDRVLNAAKILNDHSIGWYIIGGEPTEEFVEKKEEMGLRSVHYVDFKKKDELKKYYRAADLFVLMTVGDVWGLVINEAMSCGLPIITTDRCVAGLEMVENGENGYIIHVGDEKALAANASLILNDDELRKNMSENNLKKVDYWTIENMADKHIEILCEM